MTNNSDTMNLSAGAADLDSGLLALGQRLDELWAAERTTVGPWELRESALARTSACVDAILNLPAHTLPGLRVKARAVSWCHCGDADIRLADQPATDLRLAESIVQDLLRNAA